MKWLLYLLATVIVVAAATLLAIEDRGYVLINIWGYTIESSLVTWLVVLVLTFFTLHYTLRLLTQFFNVPHDMKQWREQRRQNHANQSLLDGLVKLSEGNWRIAEKEVLKHISESRVPMLNYLAAARAAHELNEYDRRDRYLKLAGQNAKVSDVGVKLTQAELQMNQHQQEQALATLRTLQQADPQHRTVIKILAQLYRELGEWTNFLKLIPSLRKQKIYKADDLNKFERDAYIHLLTNRSIDTYSDLSDIWYRMPQNLKNQSGILTIYIKQLLKLGQSDIAEPLIRNALKQEWNEDLIRLYGVIDGADAKSQLAHAEGWLKSEEHNSFLLLTLGRLSLRNNLWGKARSYLEASIGANGPVEAYNELAHLLENMGEKELAVKYYREGLSRAPNCENTVAVKTRLLEFDQSNKDTKAAITGK